MIKKLWNKLNTNEKVMIGFILLFVLMILMNWSKVSEGFKEGIKPYNETKTLD